LNKIGYFLGILIVLKYFRETAFYIEIFAVFSDKNKLVNEKTETWDVEMN